MIAGGPPHGWRTEAPRLLAAVSLVVLTGLVAFLISLQVTHISATGPAAVRIPSAPTATPAPTPLADIALAALPRTVTVESEQSDEESLGTGWLIDANCDYVTNAHVVYGEQTMRITDRSNHIHTVVVAGVDDAADIALLHCTDGYQPGAPLAVDSHALTQTPLPVVVLASSRATGQDDMTPETITGLHEDVPLEPSEANTDPQAPSVYHDMLDLTGNRVYQGNSGGPVLNQSGQVVGILTLASPDTDEAFAIPISRVITELLQFEHKA